MIILRFSKVAPCPRILIRLLIVCVFLSSGINNRVFKPTLVHAQQASSVTLSASIGFDDNVKPETWVPVQVKLENTGPSIQGYVQVNFPDIEDRSVYRFPVELPSGAKKALTVYAYMPSYAYEAEIAFYSGQTRQANKSLQINLRTTNDQVFGIIAETPSAFNVLNLVDPPNGDAFTAELELEDIPDSSLAMESLDVILFSNIDSGQLSQAQVQSLEAWVTNGGQLILTGGSEWKKETAGFTQSNLLPLLPTGTQIIHEWGAFSTLASSQAELSGQGVATTGSLAPGVEVIAANENGLPLILQKNLGAGKVVLITVDPSSAPLEGWQGLESLYRYILSSMVSAPPWQQGINDWYSASNAAQTLPNLSLPPALLVCGFLVVYMMILGPVNYLVVRRLKRRELGWFTTSGLIILFSLLVLVSGGLSRNRQPILNRLSVLQVWPGAQLARMDSVLGIYSPFRSTYQLDFPDNILAHGFPSNMSAINRGATIYQSGSGGYISDLRVEVSSIQPVSLEGFVTAPTFEGDLAIAIDANGAQVVGNVTNLSELALEEASLITSGGAVRLGTFQPGETKEVRQALNRSAALQPSITGSYPAKPVYSPSGPFTIPIYYSSNNYTLEYIVGTNNFYSSREVYRKFSLASSIINNSNAVTTMGHEIYLSGWTEQPVLQANLHAVDSDTQDTTLVLVRFDPAIEITGEEIMIAPEFFSWTPLDVQSSSYSPYQLYFYGAEIYGFAYKPTLAVDFNQVSQLFLHLESSGRTGPASEVDVYLWNLELADWEKIPGMIWGENPIITPQQFVQPDGTIQLQLRGAGQYVDITRADFTLFTLLVKK